MTDPATRCARPRTCRTRRLSRAVLVLGLVSAAGLVHAADAPAPALCKPPPQLWSAKSNEPPPPPDDRGCDILRYDLDLRLDPATRTITGTVGIHLAATAPLARLRLDLVPEMTVTGISDAHGPLAFGHDGAVLTIDLREALAPAGIDSVRIAWTGAPARHGSFAAGLMFRTHDPGTPLDPGDDVPVIANMSQPWSAHSWWPCKDHPADKALVSLAATVPDTLGVVGNGRLVAVTTPEPGWRRYAWREQYPLPTYLVSLAASNYVSWSEDCPTAAGPPVRLEYHVFPEDRDRAIVDLAPSCAMMAFLTGVLGPWPYPGEKYAQVEFKWIGAMEHTTATSIAQLAFSGDGRFENLFVHEMVHQWFGDSLTPAAWADIWLNEGFARYGEALWVEHTAGPDALGAFMAGLGARGHPDLFVGAGRLADPDPILPNLLVYDKGAWVLHMLRGLVGEEAFFAFLAAYAGDPDLVHGSVRTADMIAAAEAAAGRSLARFFGPWLETDEVPLLGLDWRPGPRGTVILTLSQHQSPLFELPVPVVIHTGCGETRLQLPLDRASRTWTVPVACPVDSVRIDADTGALLRHAQSPPPPLAVRGPVPNPAGAAGPAFELFLTMDSQVVVNIYDVTGAIVQNCALGSVAATGPEATASDPVRWRWDPATAGGPRLPAGLYFLEFRVDGGGRQVRRVVLVR